MAARWFARLRDLLPVGADEVFPSDSLLDHVPSLIVDISSYVKAPEDAAIAANTQVTEKARELGALRHQQRASLHQVLREYQLLGAILLRFVQDESIRLMLAPPPAECMTVVSRLHQAVEVLLQETVETFVALYTETITQQSERLRQFARMATHEWRQPLAPIMTGVSLLRMPGASAAQHAQIIDMIERNVVTLSAITQKLERLARLDGADDTITVQEMSVGVIANEAARQLREMADARGVEICIGENLPSMVVDVGRLELALLNLLSNAIKYSDSAKPRRTVHVTARHDEAGDCVITVRDNGVGIPAAQIGRIFQRFTRAHTDRAEMESVGGVGLGLAIVDDCVTAMNGTITVASTEGAGTTFTVTLPCAVPPEPLRNGSRAEGAAS